MSWHYYSPLFEAQVTDYFNLQQLLVFERSEYLNYPQSPYERNFNTIFAIFFLETKKLKCTKQCF